MISLCFWTCFHKCVENLIGIQLTWPMMLKHSKPKVHSITRWSNAKSTKLSGGSFRKCHAYAILSPVPGYSDWIRPSHPKTPGQQQHLLTALERCPLFRGIDVEVTLAKITNMKTLPGLKMECWESTSKPANCAHGMCRRYQSPLAFNGIRNSIVSWWDLPTNHKDLSNLVDAMEIICGLVLHALKQRCTVKVVVLKWPHVSSATTEVSIMDSPFTPRVKMRGNLLQTVGG